MSKLTTHYGFNYFLNSVITVAGWLDGHFET